MKRIILSLLAIIMVISMLAGCTTPPTTAATTTKATTAATTGTAATSGNMAAELKALVAAGKHPITGSGIACKTTIKASKEYTIAAIVKNNTNPANLAWLRGVEQACKDMGVKSVLMTPSVPDSLQEQLTIIEDMIQRKVNAVALAPVDTEGIMPGARKLHDANIPVASMTTKCKEFDTAFVGPNFYDTGFFAAEAVAKKLNGQGKIIILEGITGGVNAIDRLKGANDKFKEYPGIQIVASQTANFKRTEGMQVTENLIQKYKDIDCVFALNDEMALGAIQALKAAGMNDVLVVGFDANQDAANAILKGEMWGTFNMDHFGIGYAAAVYLVLKLDYDIVANNNWVLFPGASVTQMITKETVDDYMKNSRWY